MLAKIVLCKTENFCAIDYAKYQIEHEQVQKFSASPRTSKMLFCGVRRMLAAITMGLPLLSAAGISTGSCTFARTEKERIQRYIMDAARKMEDCVKR